MVLDDAHEGEQVVRIALHQMTSMQNGRINNLFLTNDSVL